MKDDSALNGGGVLDETGKEMEGGNDTQTALGVETGVSGGGGKTRRNKSAKNKRNKSAKNKSAKNKSAKNKRNKNAKNKRNKSSNKRKKSGKR
tara:strand:- start:3014 stop:3292 length:279 start_codon:yes stop_codon:yes gene_type:complete